MVYLKIGATIVGGIKTKYSSIKSFHQKENKIFTPVNPIFSVKKAQEIASFELGSMVILMTPEKVLNFDIFVGKKVQVGEKIGEFSN